MGAFLLIVCKSFKITEGVLSLNFLNKKLELNRKIKAQEIEIQQLKDEKNIELNNITELKEQTNQLLKQNKEYENKYVHTGLECEFCYTTLQHEFVYCPKCGKKIVRKKLKRIETRNDIFRTQVDGDCLLITQYNGFNDKKIIIPSSINGRTIIGIWNDVFKNCKELEEVVFEEGCRYIGKNAFAYCRNLKKVKLPKSLLEIGTSAFQVTGIEEIVLPPNVKVIGDRAFYETKLKKIILPDKLRSISRSMLESSLLEEIDIPQSVVHIENSAFKNTRLKEVELPHDLYSIGESAFEIPGLKKIIIHSNVQMIERNAISTCGKPVVYCARGSKGLLYARKHSLICEEIAAQPVARTPIQVSAISVLTEHLDFGKYITEFWRYCGIYKAETWSWDKFTADMMYINKNMEMEEAVHIKNALEKVYDIYVKTLPSYKAHGVRKIEISDYWGSSDV